ncbi:unnamed protein product [Acanthosepion pharaonis]|uniref:Uncharacterized protein n=1 Tax=Acanthosepion pharaonis TaxID=158019 RepID=A0A812CID7_ACAPH|nr:unnamed protein product [Sepia pharaonis]
MFCLIKSNPFSLCAGVSCGWSGLERAAKLENTVGLRTAAIQPASVSLTLSPPPPNQPASQPASLPAWLPPRTVSHPPVLFFLISICVCLFHCFSPSLSLSPSPHSLYFSSSLSLPLSLSGDRIFSLFFFFFLYFFTFLLLFLPLSCSFLSTNIQIRTLCQILYHART